MSFPMARQDLFDTAHEIGKLSHFRVELHVWIMDFASDDGKGAEWNERVDRSRTSPPDAEAAHEVGRRSTQNGRAWFETCRCRSSCFETAASGGFLSICAGRHRPNGVGHA